jgi:hypothetical protein
MAHSIQVVFDCPNRIKLYKFYAAALHYKPWDPPSGYSSVRAWLKAQGVPEGECDSAALILDPEGIHFLEVYPRIFTSETW